MNENLKSGIYKITCIPTGHFYIGQATNCKKRWTKHKYQLRKNTHWNNNIQNLWNQYGEKNFDFTIIKCAEISELDKLEKDIIKNNINNNFNLNKIITSSRWKRGKENPTNINGNPMQNINHTKESKNLISKNRKGLTAGKKNPKYDSTKLVFIDPLNNKLIMDMVEIRDYSKQNCNKWNGKPLDKSDTRDLKKDKFGQKTRKGFKCLGLV